MKIKYTLINLETDESKQYKTLREISKELNIDYFQIRELRMNTITPKKYLHNQHKKLSNKYKIIDNLEL